MDFLFIQIESWRIEVSIEQTVKPFEVKMWFAILGCLKNWLYLRGSESQMPQNVLEYTLHLFAHTQTHTHKQDYVVVHQWSGLFQPAPGCASLSSKSTPQPQSLSSPPPSQSPGSAPTPYSLQIASPSHLSQPIINYWWMGRLTGLRDSEGRESSGKSMPEGEEEEVSEKSTVDGYYRNKLTTPLWYSGCWDGGRGTADRSRQLQMCSLKILGQKENNCFY